MNARRCCVLVLAAIFIFINVTEATNCCPEDNIYDRKKRSCVDGDEESNIRIIPKISCEAGKYLLEPHKDPLDSFVIKEDEHLHIGNGEATYIARKTEFCITKTVEENDSSILHEVALVCFPEADADQSTERSFALRVYFGTLLVISIVFLFITFSIYILIPELRDLQGRCIMSTVMSLMFAYLVLAGLQFRGHLLENGPCLFSAFFLYFWMLASFFWLNISSFNVWRTIEYQSFPLTEKQLFWVFLTYGWGCPFIFLCAALITHHGPENDNVLKPNFAYSSCWFHGEAETWAYFYGPISILLALNVIFFLMTVFRLWKYSGSETTVPGLRSSRFKCILYLKVFMIMGILWIFEVLSYLVQYHAGFWNVTDTLNSLQGVFIFIIVVCRKRVLASISKREWGRSIIDCCCPQRCLSGPDLEQEEAMLACPADDETYVAMDAPARRQT